MRVGRVAYANQGMGVRTMGTVGATTATVTVSPPNPPPHTMNSAHQSMSAVVLRGTTQNWVWCVPIPTMGSVFVGMGLDLPIRGIHRQMVLRCTVVDR